MQKKTNQPTPGMKKDVVAKKHFGYRMEIFLKLTSNFPFSSDLRAKLEVAIEKVLNAVRLVTTFSRQNRGFTDDDDDANNSSSVTTSDNEEVSYSIKLFLSRE